MKECYCYLERFNNYFNRKIIKYDSLEDYQTASKGFFIPTKSDGTPMKFDFNPNDNVMTEIIGNDCPFTPDYLLVFDEEQNIKTRWFVLEEKRNRNGQWVYTLRRDVISDNLDVLLPAPIFVHKAMLDDSNPLILNSEGMNFNQIKTSETLLKDKTKSAWLVMYLSKTLSASDVNASVVINPPDNYVTLSTIATALGINESDLVDLLNFNNETTLETKFTNRIEVDFESREPREDNLNKHTYDYGWNLISDTSMTIWSAPNRLFDITANNVDINQLFNSAVANHKAQLVSDMATILNQNYYLTADSLEILKTYLSSPILYLGKYYSLNIIPVSNESSEAVGNFAYNQFLGLKQVADEVGSQTFVTLRTDGRYNTLWTNYDVVIIQLNEIADMVGTSTLEAEISSSRELTLDQPYDIVCMPADNIPFYHYINFPNGEVKMINNGDYARKIMNAFVVKESSNIYDAQLLPYCPISELLDAPVLLDTDEGKKFDYITISPTNISGTYSGNKSTTVTDMGGYYHVVLEDYVETESGKAVTIDSYSYEFQDEETTIIGDPTISVNDATGVLTIEYDANASGEYEAQSGKWNITYSYNGKSRVGVLFYAPKSSFQTQLNYRLDLKESMKIDSQCDKYRLTSPNYQGSFEFNVASNGGSVPYFTAYCTYKPYTPFIKVVPQFNFVYGAEFNDNRGLICGGDFSLPRVDSAWQSYVLQNKNYQNIFNRDIEHLDFMQSLEMRNQIVSGSVGILTDTAKGAGAGAYVAGPIGAGIGAGVAGLSSSVGFAIDVDTLARTQRENRQLAIDKYNYQLGNIKALPYTLTKIGAFDISSKVFPFLEYYTCSEQEKQALRNKITYESMTVMAIGSLRDYYNIDSDLHYFKGELIRCDDIADDPHTLNAIYEELLKGVFI